MTDPEVKDTVRKMFACAFSIKGLTPQELELLHRAADRLAQAVETEWIRRGDGTAIADLIR